jgi:hypothetical protein
MSFVLLALFTMISLSISYPVAKSITRGIATRMLGTAVKLDNNDHPI